MPVSNVTQDTGCKRTEKKNSKPLTRFPGSKFSFRLNLDEKLQIIGIWCLNLVVRTKTLSFGSKFLKTCFAKLLRNKINSTAKTFHD